MHNHKQHKTAKMNDVLICSVKAQETNLPLKILLLSDSRIFSWLVGVLFEKSVSWVIHFRQEEFIKTFTNPYILAICTLLFFLYSGNAGILFSQEIFTESGGQNT